MTQEEIDLMRKVSNYFYDKRLQDSKADEFMNLLNLTANVAIEKNKLDIFKLNLLKLTKEEIENVWEYCLFNDKKNKKKIKPFIYQLFAKEIQTILINKFHRRINE